MPEELTEAGVRGAGVRAERAAFGDLGRDSIMPPIAPAELPIRRSDEGRQRARTSAAHLAKQAAKLPSSVARSLSVEQSYGHGFLFVPVLIGLGSALWFLAPQDISLWPCLCIFLLSGAAALMSRAGTGRMVLMTISLVGAGMMLAGIETWRRGTVILDAPVTTTVTGVVERGEAVGTGMRYLVSVAATSEPSLHRPPQLVSLVARGRHEPFESGASITGRARLSPPSGPALPGLNDFAFSAYFDGIGAVGHFYGAPKAGPPIVGQQGVAARMERWLFALRRQIGDRIRSIAQGDAGAFAAAIVTDERRAISNETVEALRVSGLAHIVAISGLNMALAAGIFFVGLRTMLALSPGIAQALPVKKIAAGGALAMVTGYYLISGFGVSAQRAYIMMAVILVAVLVDRPSISLRNVALSALIIIIWTSSEILGPSFQMSFAATAALVAGYAAWARRARERPYEPLPFRHPAVTSIVGSWNFIAGIVLTSLIGSLATAMFSVEHFHRIATYGLAANLAAMPIISFLVMPAGLMAMLLMPFGLDAPFITIMAGSLDWVIVIARHVAGWGGDVVIGQQHPWFLPLGATGFLLLTLLRTKLRLAGIPLLAAALALFGTYNSSVSEVMISEDGTLVGISTQDGFAINRSRPPTFIYDQWRRARRLPDAQRPIELAGTAPKPDPAAADARLSRQAISDAHRVVREASKDRFTCLPRAFCAIVSPQGVIIVAVEDGRYAGIACDAADLLISPRARFDTCRSGAPMLNGATLRKTGALEINFAGSRHHEAWQITSAMAGDMEEAGPSEMAVRSRPWTIHRQYDWRRDVYDAGLPEWLAAANHPVPLLGNQPEATTPPAAVETDFTPPLGPFEPELSGSGE